MHGTDNYVQLRKPAARICLDCHGPSPNGPQTATIEDHTHHAKGSAGGECVACHMPKTEQTIANVNVRSQTFKFITPSMSDQLKIPNACTGCHTDRSNDWATMLCTTTGAWLAANTAFGDLSPKLAGVIRSSRLTATISCSILVLDIFYGDDRDD